ncbi:C40 family peptidase [Hymenobacter properus]|uniref:C40 family peptidase n=1 Tax=Hymenobacter properus TaxID=2791026 RepID=A0A931BDP1_9BACT|nr:C40 family peptidase [Hymenobacter properus]MBF9140618.1 C40 family peptidase [Hymenobacter properus]MBR7719426.1 C40 family peptidase [Microvirga sp. SRT04]
MRFVWMAFAGLMALMVLVLPRLGHRTPQSKSVKAPPPTSAFASLREPPRPGLAARADSLVAFGLAQRGTPYVYAGTSPLTGFDCSGFIMYTFAHFGVAVPHSTALLIDVGRPVPRAEAQPGDIVVFTGTASTSTTPGHAGIVISKRGEVPLRFVHASSGRREPFVKVSQVEDSDYERRFMQVRRVLGAGEVTAARPKSEPATPRKTPIAALPVHDVPVAATAEVLAPALPQKLPTKKYAKPAKAAAARKATAAKKRTAPKTTAAAKAPAKKKVAAKKAASKPAAKPRVTTRKR